MDSRDRLRLMVVEVSKSATAIIERKTLEQYRARLWSACVRLFNGGRDSAFEATFIRSIDQQLTDAWNKGASDMGVQPDEMEPDDIAILESIINNETEFVGRLAGDIQADKDAGMEPIDFDSKYSARVDIWANRYKETINRARMQFGSKARLIWTLGTTEEHCPECSALNGIVAFGREWQAAELQPQAPPNPLLTCHGWRCDCSLTPTTARRTIRALDRLTEIAMRRAGG